MPAAPEIAAILRRPFAEQLAFFRHKLGNLVPTATWRDLWQAAHDTGFMVAGAAKADLLADLAQAVDAAIAEGETIEEFRKRFGAIVEKHGWHGWTGEETKAGRAWRTRVIYTTNLRTSYAAGRYAQLKEFPFWVYRHSGAENPRLQHLAWDGLTLPANHPFWKTHYPPNGWNCFPGWVRVQCDALLGQRIRYSGQIVEFETRLGRLVAVTPNHPVLTARGWVAADKLMAGDQVIAAARDIDSALCGIVDDPQPPTRADDLFDALASQGLRVVPMTPHDFYGDAACGQQEVEIAGSDGALMDVLDAAGCEFLGEHGLHGRLALSVESADDVCRASFEPFVGGDAVLAQDAADGGLGDADASGDGGLTRQAGSIHRQDLVLDVVVSGVGGHPGPDEIPLAPVSGGFVEDPSLPGRCGTAADFNAAQPQDAPKRVSADAELYRELLEANSGYIAADEIVFVSKCDWSGHVYDFTTRTGLILADGVVVSNCGCRVAGARSRAGARRLGGRPDYDAPPPGWDVPDPKTGLLPGIQEGWGYAPGRRAEAIKGIARALARHDPVMADLAATFAPKTVAWPYELAKAYMAGVPEPARDALALAVRAQPQTGEAVRRYAQRALADGPESVEPYRTMGLLTADEAARIAEIASAPAVRQQLYDWALDRFAPIHIRNEHGNEDAEAARGQIAVVVSDYARLPRLILEGRLSYAGKTDIGRDAVEIVAALEDAEYHAVFEILPKRRMLALKTLWKTGRPPVIRP